MNGKALQYIIPFLAAAFGIFVGTVPLTLFGRGIPSPLFALMPVYFWALVRPDVMKLPWVFLIGVLQDLFSGGAPGIWGMGFIAAYVLIDRQRDNLAGLSGMGAIIGFSGVMLVTSVAAYVSHALFYQQLLPVSPFVVQFAITVLLYIPGAYLIGAAHRRFVGPMRED